MPSKVPIVGYSILMTVLLALVVEEQEWFCSLYILGFDRKHAVEFSFQASNNMVEYEALIHGLEMSK